MKSNQDLQADVQNAIKLQPLLNAAEIGVTAKDGVVSLTGNVDCYLKKMEAEKAAKSVPGLKALVENIVVQFQSPGIKTDLELANEIILGLKLNWSVPNDKVTVTVEDGWVTLEGVLHWNYQKEAAKNSVNHLTGVKGVSNHISIRSESNVKIEKQEVEDALAKSWSVDDTDIIVEVLGTTITLTGTVNSWAQKEEAGRVAWNTQGICQVKNELAVDYEFAFS